MNPQDPMVVQPNATPPQPNMMFQPSAPQGPSADPSMTPGQPQYGQQPQSFVAPPTNTPAPAPRKSSKKPLIVGGVLVGLLIVITIAAIALGGVGTKDAPQAPQESEQAQGPQPARAIDVEQSSNSIGQDITSHDNNKDFPPNQFDDKTLGL